MKEPGALLPYKDTLLLIANEGFISFFDITKFPPLLVDFKEDGIPLSEKTHMDLGNNSICARNPAATYASLGMSFLTMNKESVSE